MADIQAPPAVEQASKDTLEQVKAPPAASEGNQAEAPKVNLDEQHPLASRWTLWYDNPTQQGHPKSPKASWGDSIYRIVDVDSVEEFWGMYNNIVPASSLPMKANYYLFKGDIKPMWEDPANEHGGKWSARISRQDKKHAADVDRYWLHTMLAAIGETLELPHTAGDQTTPSLDQEKAAGQDSLVTGVLLAARPPAYRIAIWTRRAVTENEAESIESQIGQKLLDIGKNFKVHCLESSLDEHLAQQPNTEVEFQSHGDGDRKNRKGKIVL